jgi:hypothetical protein
VLSDALLAGTYKPLGQDTRNYITENELLWRIIVGTRRIGLNTIVKNN